MDNRNTSSVLQGTWSYRSFSNTPDLDASFDSLEFGIGTLRIDEPSGNVMLGTIGGPGWQLALQGSVSYGDPGKAWFTGRGLVAGVVASWIAVAQAPAE